MTVPLPNCLLQPCRGRVFLGNHNRVNSLHAETPVTVTMEQDVLEDVESVEICATLNSGIESDRMLILATSDGTGNVDDELQNPS